MLENIGMLNNNYHIHTNKLQTDKECLTPKHS